MVKISKEAALAYHEAGRPGKIEVKPLASPTPVWKSSRTPTMRISIQTRATSWLSSPTVRQYWVWVILVP